MINCHTHIFTDASVPAKFLPFGLVRFLSKSRITRKIAKIVHWINPFSDNDVFERFALFLERGSRRSQSALFDELRSFYPDGTRFAVLSMDMEYMGCGTPLLPFTGQLDDLADLKQRHGDCIYPFIAVDPRRPGIVDLVKHYIEEKGFCGIKLYPALGFFPYDERLTELWEYAQEKGIPVITHVSKIGIFCRGPFTQEMFAASRIGSIDIHHHTAKGLSDFFSHPLHYRYLLEDFPRLKICLAHCGGETEWWRHKHLSGPQTVPDRDKDWLDLCISLVRDYAGCYTDLSFTLGSDDYQPMIRNLLADPVLRTKILFGSDFYMVELKSSEPDYIEKARAFTGDEDFELIASVNPRRFLNC